ILFVNYPTYLHLALRSLPSRRSSDLSIEELGIGLLVSLGALLVIGQIKLGMSAEEVVGKIIVEAMFVSIGVSIGTAQLGEDSKRSEEHTSELQSRENLVCRLLLEKTN